MYWKLKEGALDCAVWRTRFRRGFGPVVACAVVQHTVHSAAAHYSYITWIKEFLQYVHFTPRCSDEWCLEELREESCSAISSEQLWFPLISRFPLAGGRISCIWPSKYAQFTFTLNSTYVWVLKLSRNGRKPTEGWRLSYRSYIDPLNRKNGSALCHLSWT
jgi:hypothetical protein